MGGKGQKGHISKGGLRLPEENPRAEQLRRGSGFPFIKNSNAQAPGKGGL